MKLMDKILNRKVIIKKAEEGGYFAFVPSLPGCMTQGETLKEIEDNILDVVNGYSEVLREDGNVI